MDILCFQIEKESVYNCCLANGQLRVLGRLSVCPTLIENCDFVLGNKECLIRI